MDGGNVSLLPVVEMRGVEARPGGQAVLRGVNLRIPKGQMAALIGPNGSGKTTLLRCLLGLQKLTAGEVRLFGKADLVGALPRVGYVPQRVELERGFNLSVREFMALRVREARDWFWRRHSAVDAAIGPLVADMGLGGLLHRPMGGLSGGQLQRVLIAFSLARKPELLLLDEPTAGVDTPGEATFYELIAEVQKRLQLTILLVSHDLSMVSRHADWVYALNGVICCEGPPDEIMNQESLQQAYGLHATTYHHHHHHVHVH